MDFFQFSVPTKIVFSPGIAKDFSAELAVIGIQKYLLVTDKILLELKVVDPVIQGLKLHGYKVVGVFKDIPPDSGVKTIEACAGAAKDCGAEGIIAVGGGSVLDTAKGANILFTLGGNLIEDYSGAQTITRDLSPLIAIPTTAGTGSEVTEAIVILDESNSTKISFVDSHLLPRLAVLDPELTVGLPPKMTAATALDALTHATEAIMSVQRGPIPDALALKAIQLIFGNIEKAVKDGHDMEARGALLVAANLAGMAFNHAMVGVVHAVAHSIGGLFHVHHGTANGIFLPYGMEYNLKERAREIAAIAPVVGAAIHKDPAQTARHVIAAYMELRQRVSQLCGLPITLSGAGVPREGLAQIAEKAPDDGASFYNPRLVETAALMPYLEKAF